MNNKVDSEIPKSQKYKLAKRILFFSILVLVIVVVVSLIFAPRVVKNYINKHGKELAGRTVQIEDLQYNYFTSTLKINGFKYFENNDSDVFMAFDTLMVNLKPLKLLHDEIYIEQLQLVNPLGNIIQNGDSFNFDDLMTFFAGTDSIETPEDVDNSTSYKLNLNNLEMKRGSVSYVDLEINNTMKIEDISFIIPQILWSKLDSSKADVEFKLANGGNFAGWLNYNADLGEYAGTVKIDDLQLQTFLPYVQQYFKVSNISGLASGVLNFNGLVDDLYKVTLDGTFEVDSLLMYDLSNRKVLGGKYSRVIMKPSEVMKYQVELDTVLLVNPYMYLALEDSLFNFEKMIVESTEGPASDSSATEDEPMDVVLSRFIIQDGLMDFSDQTMREVFDYELSKITVDMDTFSLDDDWININANMKLNKRGTLEAKLSVNPLDPLSRIELEYVLTDFQLPDINIYSKHYAGLPILFGDMYYVNKTSIVNKQLESNNQLIIRNVEMGRKTGGLYDVPVKLALFILKDINGDIILDIPVRGDLSDPKVRIGKIVWDTFKGFMFKIVASPFKALGNLLGANSQELEEITFNYGDTTLINKQTKSFDLLLELEKKKPELKAELRYLNDKKLEKTDAASELSKIFYFNKYGKKPNPNSKEYLQFLKDETGKDSLVVQDFELLLAPKTMVDSIIEQREKTRFKLSQDYLTSKNDSTTIRIFGYNKDEVLNIGSRPRFEVKFVLAEDAEE